MRPITNPDFNSIFEDMLPIAKANPQYIDAYLLTGTPEQKLVAAMIKDMPQSQAPAAPAQAPTQTVIDKKIAESQGLAQLAQGMPQQGQAPQQMVEEPMQQMAEGGIVDLPLYNGMFEGNYAGGGIVAFDDGGEIPSYASRGAVKVPAYMSSPVGKYFNPNDLATYDDAEIKKLLLENPSLTMDDVYKQQKAERDRYGIKNIYEEQKQALESDKAENEKFKASNEADALLNAAAGFLGNRSQFFGPGAEAALKGYTTTKREGQKEYRATAKDIRNLGFEIGRSDQAMRQAEMTGDRALFNSERARHEGLLKESRDINFKNVETKNNLLAEGAKSAVGYKTTMDATYAKEAGDDRRAKAKEKSDLEIAKIKAAATGDGYKVPAKVLEIAEKMMTSAYPSGSMGLLMKDRPDVYQAELNRFIQGAETYISTGELPAIPPSDAVQALLKTTTPATAPAKTPATAAKPGKLTQATIAGKKIAPMNVQSLLKKYPPTGGNSIEDEDE